MKPIHPEMQSSIDVGVMKGHFERIADDVLEERIRQIAIWGANPPDPAILISVLAEEFGEVARAFNEGDVAHMRTELVQTAAVCFRMIQAIDAGDWK